MKKVLLLFLLLSFLFIIGMSGCHQTSVKEKEEQKQQIPTMHVIKIKEFKFQPSEIIIHRGDSIVWINEDPYPTVHTVSAYDLSYSFKMIYGQNATKIFNESGTYEYYCAVHGEKGKIIVK
ncbi:MAG: cupredoxin domain-containing protein [Candidatus Pacearchaeota archaeon]